MIPFQILNVERQVQAHVEAVGEDISQMAYLALENVQDREALTEVTAFGYAEAAVRTKLKKLPVERVSLISSKLLQDGETVDLVVDYEMRLPFSIFGLDSVKRSCRCYRRAWIGRGGSSGLNEDGSLKEEIVYVGRDSTRYHVNRQCHYLSNELQAVKLGKIEDYRSLSGRRYRACSKCGDKKESNSGRTVYIMKYGESYHTSQMCPAIRAYVTAVLKSQVEHLGACSYCSKGY